MSAIPALPAGFTLESTPGETASPSMPPLPKGFSLESPASSAPHPPLPSGFTLETSSPHAAAGPSASVQPAAPRSSSPPDFIPDSAAPAHHYIDAPGPDPFSAEAEAQHARQYPATVASRAKSVLGAAGEAEGNLEAGAVRGAYDLVTGPAQFGESVGRNIANVGIRAFGGTPPPAPPVTMQNAPDLVLNRIAPGYQQTIAGQVGAAIPTAAVAALTAGAGAAPAAVGRVIGGIGAAQGATAAAQENANSNASLLAQAGNLVGKTALGYAAGRFIPPAAGPIGRATAELPLLPRVAARLASHATEGAAVNAAGQIGSNLVSKATIAPETPVMEGVGRAAAVGATYGVGSSALHGGGSAAPDFIPETPLTKGTAHAPENVQKETPPSQEVQGQRAAQQPPQQQPGHAAGQKVLTPPPETSKPTPLPQTPPEAIPAPPAAETTGKLSQPPEVAPRAATDAPAPSESTTGVPVSGEKASKPPVRSALLGERHEGSDIGSKTASMFGDVSPGPASELDAQVEREAAEQKRQGEHTSKLFGPGASSTDDPNSFRNQTSIATLTDRIASQSHADSPISARMSLGEKIATKAADTKDAVSTGLAKLRAGAAAMYDAWKRPPTDTDYTRQTGKWSGADQRSAVDIENFKKAATKQVPDKTDRGAIGIFMEAGGDKATLQKWADAIAANPKTQRYTELFRRAAALNDAHQNVARDTSLHNDATLDEAKKAGILSEGVDNYLMHVWKNNPDQLRRIAAESNFNSLITKPGFTRQRTIPTYFDGIMKGMHPQDLDFASLTAAHERSFREALAARAFVRSLYSGKASDGRPLATVSAASARELDATAGKPDAAYLVKPNLKAADKVADYLPIDHPSLRGWRWAAEVDGKPMFVQGDMLVHPEIYQHLKNNLTRSAIQNWEVRAFGRTLRPGAAALRVNQEIKSAVLSLSAFHQTTLGIHGLEHGVNPVGMPELDLHNPVQGKLVDHGLMVAHYNAAQELGEGVQAGGLVTKIPGIGPMYHAYTDYLFKDYMPRLKMAMAKAALERNTQRYAGKLNEDQIYALTANQANAAFGGLNYRMLGRNKTFQDTLRLMFMAPDFSEARGRFTAQALKPYGTEQRKALMLGAAVMYTAARALNTLVSDDHDPHWGSPFSLFVGGKEYSLRTIQGDLLHAASHPGDFIKNRLSPLFASFIGGITGTNHFGGKVTPTQSLINAGKSLAPIPAQPWVNGSTDSNAQKAVETALKMVGVNEKSAAADHSPAVRKPLPQLKSLPSRPMRP